MKFIVIHGSELTPDLTTRWAEIQQADFSLASPYFRPEFTQAVADVRDDVYVGLLANEDRIIGFFPFHRKRGKVARPVGLGLSDYHGVIAEPDSEWTTDELLSGCKLVRWEFDHLPVSQHRFAGCYTEITDSPIIDVSQGMEAFEASRDKYGRKQLRETQRKSDKLNGEVGPLTFSVHEPRQDVLRQLMGWKSQQCQRTGTVDFFALEWCVQLIERIHATREANFGGILSCLHAGDTLAAIHFAMYSHHVWHSWFPAYNQDFEKYSPGLILLLEITKAAASQKIKYIDLGKGLSLYKKKMMTGGIPVAEGCVEIPSFCNHLRQMRDMLEQWGRRPILRPVLRIPGRVIKGIERKRRFE